MKKNVLRLSAMLLCGALAFTACKKKSDTPAPTNSDSTQQAATARDQADYTNNTSQAADEANVIASNSSSNARLSATSNLIIGATIDSSKASTKGIYAVTYSGICSTGKTRTGWDSIWVVGKWHVAGSYIVMKYDYTVTKKNGKKMTLVGQDTITNVSGGNIVQLAEGNVSSLVTNHTGTAQVTFDNGTSRKWSHARQRTTTYASGVITITVDGIGSVGGATNVSEWGVNRAGETFYGEITTPIVWTYDFVTVNNTCATWPDPVSGVYYHKGTGSGLIVTYGVTNDGSPIASGGCPYGYKLNWTGPNNTPEQLIEPYLSNL